MEMATVLQEGAKALVPSHSYSTVTLKSCQTQTGVQ